MGHMIMRTNSIEEEDLPADSAVVTLLMSTCTTIYITQQSTVGATRSLLLLLLSNRYDASNAMS
eukprot:scaffold10827_cov44-Cyclotella_meneghiniana.AAC.1